MKAIWMGKLLKLAGYESGRDVHKMELCIDLCLDIYLLNYIKNYIFDTWTIMAVSINSLIICEVKNTLDGNIINWS